MAFLRKNAKKVKKILEVKKMFVPLQSQPKGTGTKQDH